MNQHLILFFLNLFLVIFVIFNYLIGSKGRFFRIPDNVDVNIFVLIYILSAGIFSIIVAITNSSKMHGIALLAHSIIHIGNHPQDAEKIYTTLQCDNYIKEVDEARGIYLYNMAILIMAGLLRTFCLNPTECYLPIEKVRSMLFLELQYVCCMSL